MPWFIKVPWLPPGIGAITLWFLVLYEGKISERTKIHETIHYLQYNELLVVGFLALYLFDFLREYWTRRDFWKSYFHIRFEQEAYANQEDISYIFHRPKFNWLNYNADHD